MDTKLSERNLQIFLVDDDSDDRNIFAKALNDIAPEVDLTVYHSGEDLLEELKRPSRLPDILFLDLYMPMMDGLECLNKIRLEQRLDSICIIIYSTIINLEIIEELFEFGANRYLRKPSSYSALKNALERAIESVRDNPRGGHTIINYSE